MTNTFRFGLLIILAGMVLGLPTKEAVAFQNLNRCMRGSHTMSADESAGNFYMNNTCNIRICVTVSLDGPAINARGSVISGVLLMNANEQNHLIGSFMRVNANAGWNVHITSRATDECY